MKRGWRGDVCSENGGKRKVARNGGKKKLEYLDTNDIVVPHLSFRFYIP